jgi:hypothetical protein
MQRANSRPSRLDRSDPSSMGVYHTQVEVTKEVTRATRSLRSMQSQARRFTQSDSHYAIASNCGTQSCSAATAIAASHSGTPSGRLVQRQYLTGSQ